MKKTLFLSFSLLLLACTKEIDSSKTGTTPTVPGGTIGDTTKTGGNNNGSNLNGINFSCVGTPVGSFQNNVTDVEGNSYKTVKIGTQIWMAENLKTSKYNDGTVIPNISDNTQWSNLTTGAWAYHNNDAANNAKYGKLYNWYAVSSTTNGNKNVCPTGWHVPTDTEWMVLTDYLGSDSVAGGKMKEVGTINWNSPNTNATNTSLFSGLPGGYFSSGFSKFNGIGYNANWWSTTVSNSVGALYLILSCDDNEAGLDSQNKKSGFSIRCLKN